MPTEHARLPRGSSHADLIVGVGANNHMRIVGQRNASGEGRHSYEVAEFPRQRRHSGFFASVLCPALVIALAILAFCMWAERLSR